jgi:hypothetical protein
VGTVLGGLYLPQFAPYDAQRSTINAINAAGGMVNTQTALLGLQESQRLREAEALARQEVQHDPSLLFGGRGPQSPGSILGGGVGPMTQQAFGPGGVGPTQQVPGGQDLSRFAGVSPQGGGPMPPGMAAQVMPTVTPTGGGPVLAGGGLPQAPGQGPSPQDRLIALARTNPEAALMIQRQQQAQEDMQIKRQTDRLTMGEKVMEYLGRSAQGVTDQAGLDRLRAELQQQNLGKYAAQLPQVYSKEAMQAIAAKALSVKDSLTLDITGLKAQADMLEARRKGQLAAVQIPEYTGDSTLNAAIYERMKGQPPGTRPPEDVIAAARKDVEEGKVNVARQTGAAQAGEQALDDPTRQRVTAYRRGETLANQLLTEFTAEERAKFVGMGGMRMTGKQLEAWLSDATKRQADPRFSRFLTLLNEAKTEAFATGGKALTGQEAEVVFGYIPTGQEMSVEQFEQKLAQARNRSSERLDEEIKLATTPKRALAGERISGTLARPGGGQGTTTTGKGGTVKLETLADYAAKHNLPIGKVIKDATAKGLEIE